MNKSRAAATFYNIAGSAAPIIVTIWAVPNLLRVVGVERFGVIAIVALITGYSGVFDFGLSRATTNLLANLRNSVSEFSNAYWTSVYTNIFFGFFGGFLIFFALEVGANAVFRVSGGVSLEVKSAIPWIAAVVPFITLTNTLNGVLDVKKMFLGANILQSIGFVAISVAPIIGCTIFEPSVSVAAASLFFARVLAVGILISYVHLKVPEVSRVYKFDRGVAGRLTGFGGWVAVTNIISQLVTTSDQIIMSNMFGAKVVAPYNIAYNVANKLLLLPIALMRASFPSLSTMGGDDAKSHIESNLFWSALIMGAVCSISICVSKFAFTLWMGSAIGVEAHKIFNILAVGILINSLAFVPYTFLQSQRRPDLVAKLHAVEFPIFLGIIFFSLTTFGPGAAPYVWVGRVSIDAIALFYLSGLRISPLFCLPIVVAAGLAVFVS